MAAVSTALRSMKRKLPQIGVSCSPTSAASSLCQAVLNVPVRWQSSASASSAPSSTSNASSSSSTTFRGARDVPASTEKRLSTMFYDPDVQLSRRQKQVFSRVSDEPGFSEMQEHGYLYGLTEEDMAGRNEMVKRALSTRTASHADLTTFQKQQLARQFETAPLDTGSSRVQSELFFEVVPHQHDAWSSGCVSHELPVAATGRLGSLASQLTHPISVAMPPFAVAMLTDKINRLTAHLQRNKQDTHSKRQLILLASRRRRLMSYMIRRDYHSYRLVVNQLNLRPIPVFNSKHTPKMRKESHKQINARNARMKNRKSRGDKGH